MKHKVPWFVSLPLPIEINDSKIYINHNIVCKNIVCDMGLTGTYSILILNNGLLWKTKCLNMPFSIQCTLKIKSSREYS